jgi:hypothetical protein
VSYVTLLPALLLGREEDNMPEEITMQSLHEKGESVYGLVAKVLRGEGTPDEECFVAFKIGPHSVLGVAMVELAKAVNRAVEDFKKPLQI